MSVDLLPREEGRQQALRRRIAIAVLAVLALWAALAIVGFAQLSVLDQRRADRDEAAQRAEQLRAQVGSLGVFQEMADDAAAGNQVLAYAMGSEISWAQMLVDLSRGVPESASFTSVAGQLGVSAAPATIDPGVVALGPGLVGRVDISGYSREIFTPGLEDLLRRFGAIDGFREQYLSAAQLDTVGDIPVTGFTASVRLDESVRTGRYTDGLPAQGG